jgi:hypothetical protein
MENYTVDKLNYHNNTWAIYDGSKLLPDHVLFDINISKNEFGYAKDAENVIALLKDYDQYCSTLEQPIPIDA